MSDVTDQKHSNSLFIHVLFDRMTTMTKIATRQQREGPEIVWLFSDQFGVDSSSMGG